MAQRLSLIQLLVAGLAAFRVTRLLVKDTIIETPRAWLLTHVGEYAKDLLTCAWCLGFWISLTVALLVEYVASPILWLILFAFALSGMTGLLARLDED